MQFLADESCDFSVVRALRDDGHDVLYAAGEGGVGVVLIRFPATSRRLLGSAVVDAVRSLADRLARSFIVVEPGRVRVGAPPPHDPQS